MPQIFLLWIIQFFQKFFGRKTSVQKAVEFVQSTLVKTKKRFTDRNGKFVLKFVKYDSQRDNKIDPHKTCYPTSIAMVLRTLEQTEYGGQAREEYLREDSEDILIKHLQDNRSFYRKITYNLIRQPWAMKMYPRYVGAFWVWYINNKLSGFKASYKYFTRKQLKDFIRSAKVPVVTSTKLTKSGHIIITTGFDENGFFCNDPYGDAKDYRKYLSPKYGERVYYEDKKMKHSIGCVVITHDKEQP